MPPKRRFGRLFWLSLTIFTMIVIAIGISARNGFGVSFVGGNITIANGRIFIWQWGKQDFEPFNPFGKSTFDEFPPQVIVLSDSIAFEFGTVNKAGLEGQLFHIVTPMVMLAGSPAVAQPIGIFLALWPFAAICLVPVGLTFLRMWRHRPQENQCRNCGYDLTANTSGRCPGCGERILPCYGFDRSCTG